MSPFYRDLIAAVTPRHLSRRIRMYYVSSKCCFELFCFPICVALQFVAFRFQNNLSSPSKSEHIISSTCPVNITRNTSRSMSRVTFYCSLIYGCTALCVLYAKFLRVFCYCGLLQVACATVADSLLLRLKHRDNPVCHSI
jgi:hypothetical protein